MDTHSLDARVAGIVNRLIADHGTTELVLANETGIPRTTLRRRLSGRSNFLLVELAAIAHYFGLGTADLLLEDAA